MDFLADLFGYVVRFIYDLTSNNYALTIILFTILTKALLFPLNLKQINSSKEMQKVKPKYDEIMKKYKNDKNKQSEEIMKLYAEHKINPMGGCLPLIITLFLVVAMFNIVKQPLTYVTEMPKEEIKIYTQEVLGKEDVSDAEIDSSEIIIANKYQIIDMNFIGLDLGDVPADVFSSDENKKSSPVSLIVPILAFVFSMLQIKLTQKSMEMTEEQKEMQKSMNITMPIMSAMISYTMPLALGIYWLLGSIIQICQTLVIKKITDKELKKDLKLLS